MRLCLLSLFMCFVLNLSSQNSDSFKFLEAISVNGEIYELKYESKESSYKIQIKRNTSSGITDEFGWDVNDVILAKGIIQKINDSFSKSYIFDSLDDDEKKALLKLKTKIMERKTASLSDDQRVFSGIDNAKDQYTGKLKLLKDITNFKITQPTKAKIRKYYSHFYNKTEVKDEVKYTIKNTNSCNHENDVLELIDATVIFFNNKASTIALNAILKCNDEVVEDLEFYNFRYSIPIRAFTYYENASNIIKSKYVLTANTKYGQIIEIHANDIFDYKSFGNGTSGNFGFSIANQRLHISNKIEKSNPVEVVQRRFFDFFTGVVYTDLMGLNTNSSNSLVNAQASLLMPMNLGNWAESTALRQFRLNINVALNNSFENEARYIGFKDSDKVNHFDLYRKQNLGALLSIDLLSYESKGWFLTSSLGYNLGFNRTGYQYTKTIADTNDDVSTGQLMSISHGPYLNFEFRPQDNFGADIMISLDELNINDDDVIDGMSFSDDILEDDKSNAFLAKHNMVNVSTNFYWLTNPGKSNGGVYAKIGLAYHIPTESSFPQLMVGYATNLTSFVNRFKQKESETKPASE